ncbi:SusC/RagA family TonB-linked outer membrane protein [Chitinophaga tropicalis]|uniref:SusC/RagA family TonB-linked outer membrane protein n=1 Tax=Chitinophaga tropicalis TaxID=2683588 RepID=A0A7K1U449_9BACT|nr:TonB-dependent receptor [Chitinophaga tropicalis]MVT09066.1 SusC/RagA family TonB-linked outer membrane protein [Chitinophaga tropicalis]
MKRFLTIFLFLFPSVTLFAQQSKITGKVASGADPLPGVTVRVKHTNQGTVTDKNGQFTLMAGIGDTLVFNHISFLTRELVASGNGPMNVSLVSNSQNVNEVVVVGYGTQKKANLTGSVGVVKMEDMESRPLTNPGQALQGTVAGVYALQSSGKPGDDGAVIDIRGVGTFGNNSPLILIDGFPGNINDVNANDIQSISVLKDAASASIYGNRAANGVVLITTKRGSASKLRVNYTAFYGSQSPTRLPHVLNAVDYTTLYNEASINSGGTAKYADSIIQKYAANNDLMYPDINYFKVYYGNANIQNHRVSISGGNDNVNYAFMLGRLNQDGILVGTNYKKTDFRSNIDAYFLKNKRLRFSGKLAGNLGVKNEPTDLWNAEWYATLAPIHPLRNAAGQWVSVNGERNYYGEIKEGSTALTKRYNFNGQVEAEYKILNGLSAQVTYGYNVMTSKANAFHANVTLYNESGTTTNLVSNLNVTNETDVQTLLTSLLKYNKVLGKHEVNLLGGYSEEEFTYDWESAYRSGFVNNTQRVLNLGDPSTQTNNAGSYDLGLRSYFARLNYAFDGKYLFEANIRRDGSSRFAKAHRWGTFPSFSAGWVLSKERFMESLTWLDLLKLRASWGRLGNQNINNYYNGSDILSSGQNYSLGGTLYSGVAVTSMTNKNLTWETAQQLDLGIDLFLKKNFEITADYFDKRTKDLLLTQSIPLTMAQSAPYANAGEVQNKGIEAAVTYRTTFSNGFKLRATVNASHIINKITRMDVAEQLTSPKAIKTGAAINSFYGYKMDGIYQISDFTWQNNSDPSIPHASRAYTLKPDVVQVSNYTAQPGDIKYKDLNGDHVVDMNNDRTIIGNQFPKLTYGFNLNMEWKGFDLGMFLQGVQGMQGYTYYEIATPFSGFANMGDWWLKRWTPDNPSNTLPRLTLDGARNNIHSSFYMENASYLRMKNIELGYSVSPKILSRAGISTLRIYGNVQNAFTITKFKGFDPEQTVDQTRAQAFPQVRIMTMGASVNF